MRVKGSLVYGILSDVYSLFTALKVHSGGEILHVILWESSKCCKLLLFFVCRFFYSSPRDKRRLSCVSRMQSYYYFRECDDHEDDDTRDRYHCVSRGRQEVKRGEQWMPPHFVLSCSVMWCNGFIHVMTQKEFEILLFYLWYILYLDSWKRFQVDPATDVKQWMVIINMMLIREIPSESLELLIRGNFFPNKKPF